MTLEELLVIHPAPWYVDFYGGIRDAKREIVGNDAAPITVALVNARAKAEADDQGHRPVTDFWSCM